MQRYVLTMCLFSVALTETQSAAAIVVTSFGYNHRITMSTAYSTYDIDLDFASQTLTGGSTQNLSVNETLALSSWDIIPPGGIAAASVQATSTVTYQPAPGTISFNMGANAEKFYSASDHLGGEGTFEGGMSMTFVVFNDPVTFSAGIGAGGAYADLTLLDSDGNPIFDARGVGQGYPGPREITATLLPGTYQVGGGMAIVGTPGREGGGGAGFGFTVVPEAPSGLLAALALAGLVFIAAGRRSAARRTATQTGL